ncbi:hypothetical protein SDC9_122038 [bioreactor metagenome]|uniref:Uncharacterized protein n=1 Tax=bioreactor metagenome TaxID=1076179 RepID=A0A645CDM5_9ZZZZ
MQQILAPVALLRNFRKQRQIETECLRPDDGLIQLRQDFAVHIGNQVRLACPERILRADILPWIAHYSLSSFPGAASWGGASDGWMSEDSAAACSAFFFSMFFNSSRKVFRSEN